jgi:hypothetical protein
VLILPAKSFPAASRTKPKAMPLAIETVKGVAMAVTTAWRVFARVLSIDLG